jgi:hypothetical protein
MVKAPIKGYEEILTGLEKAPDTHDALTAIKKTLTANDQAIADKNKKGFGDLILSIDCTKPQGRIAFAIVKNAKTKEMSGGDLM